MLAAGVTIFADQFGPAIEAMGLVRASVSPNFSGARLDGPAEQTASHGIAKRLKLAHALPPYRDIRRPSAPMLAAAHGPHRSPWRILQPRAQGTSPHQPCRDARFGARRGVVAGLAGESPEGRRQGHGPVRCASCFGENAGSAGSNSRERLRAA